MNTKEAIAFDAQLKSLRARSKYYYESVNETGLYIRVAPDSTMTWYYIAMQKNDEGKRVKRYLSLKKTYPQFTLQQAKNLAQTLNMLRSEGVDVFDMYIPNQLENAGSNSWKLSLIRVSNDFPISGNVLSKNSLIFCRNSLAL